MKAKILVKYSIWEAGTTFILDDGMYREMRGAIHGISIEAMHIPIAQGKASN